MDLIALAGVVAELKTWLIGATVQKIQQPDKSTLTIQFFGPHGVRKLRITTEHSNPRFHISSKKDAQPTIPLGFAQVARKHLEDAICVRIEMPGPDRVVWMHFESKHAQAKGDSRSALIYELMGRNTNLFLVGNAGLVRGILRPIAAESPRPLRVGQPYIDPPGLRTDRSGSYGPLVDREANACGGPEFRSVLLSQALTGVQRPVLVSDVDGNPDFAWPFRLNHVPDDRQLAVSNLNHAWDQIAKVMLTESTRHRQWVGIQKRLEDALAHREKRIVNLKRTIEESKRAIEDEEIASLIMGQIGKISPAVSVVELDDWFHGGTRTVPLDPELSPPENANKWFAKASKARDAGDLADGRLEDAYADARVLKDLVTELKSLLMDGEIDLSDPEAIMFLRTLDGVAPERQTQQSVAPGEAKWEGHKIKTYDLDGVTFLVGENATSNDYLLTRVARPHDIWMHIRAGTGAHGLIRVMSKDDRIPESLIRRAAAIVAAKSDATRHASVAAVDIAEKRYVRKPRGAKPGLAMYTQCRTIDVSPDLGH